MVDRVNLGLIPSSEESWPVACRLLRRNTGGILHIHHNVTSPPPAAHSMENKPHTNPTGLHIHDNVTSPPVLRIDNRQSNTATHTGITVNNVTSPPMFNTDKRLAGHVIHKSITVNSVNSVQSEDHNKLQSYPASLKYITPDTDSVSDETQVLHNTCKQTDREAWKAWAEHTASHIAGLLRDLTGGSWRTHIQHIEHVKSYAPHIHHIVLDLECRPL